MKTNKKTWTRNEKSKKEGKLQEGIFHFDEFDFFQKKNSK